MSEIDTIQKTIAKPSEDLSQGVLDWRNIILKEGTYATVNLVVTTAQTAANFGMFFTAWHPCEVIGASEVHGTAGSDASAVTLQLEKLTGTTAKGAGDTILVTAWNLKGTANTVVNKSGTDFDSTAETVSTDGLRRTQLQPGDRLALKSSGTLTALKDVQVTVYFRGINRGHYLP